MNEEFSTRGMKSAKKAGGPPNSAACESALAGAALSRMCSMKCLKHDECSQAQADQDRNDDWRNDPGPDHARPPSAISDCSDIAAMVGAFGFQAWAKRVTSAV